MDELQVLSEAVQAGGQIPWLVVAGLGYALARRALADLCSLFPRALDIAESAVKDGVRVRVVLVDEDEGEP